MEQKNEVLENVIRSLINTNNQVFITCHTRPDYDAIGASIGACLIAKKYKKKNYIVIDDEISSLSGVIGTKEIIEEITDQTRKKNDSYIEIINTVQMEKLLTGKDLLIVLDANCEERIPIKNIKEKFKDIIVVDHHKQTENTIVTKNKYINPYKTSTCEIIADVIQKLCIRIPDPLYADYLLAGIRLDSKRYQYNIGDRTFEIMAKLTKAGASNDRLNNMFKERDFERDMSRKKLMADNTEKVSIGYEVAITADRIGNELFLPEDVAKVADSLLEYGFNASFAIGFIAEYLVTISARSDGSIDVGKIMKLFNGGGSENSAAAKINTNDISDVINKLKNFLTPYFFVKEQDMNLKKSKKLELTL